MAKLDLAAMVPTRSYGTYPSPLSTFAAFKAASVRIVAGHETIVVIAKGVGYSSSSSLSGAWKRLTGYTPSEWRVRPAAARKRIMATVRKLLAKTS